jgi:hypothetical protein
MKDAKNLPLFTHTRDLIRFLGSHIDFLSFGCTFEVSDRLPQVFPNLRKLSLWAHLKSGYTEGFLPCLSRFRTHQIR